MGRHRLLSDEEILRRARAVFVERGYAARTRDIADAIGMSWPALVLRFGGKWELFRCAMVEPIRARATFPAAAQGAELRELLERLHALLSEQWPMRLQYRLAALSSAHDDTEELLERLRPAFEVQAQRGTIRSDIAAGALARLVLSLLVGDVAQRFVRCDVAHVKEPLPLDEIVGLLMPARATPAIGSHAATEAESRELLGS